MRGGRDVADVGVFQLLLRPQARVRAVATGSAPGMLGRRLHHRKAGPRCDPCPLLDALPLDEAIATMMAVGRFGLDPHLQGHLPGTPSQRLRRILSKGYSILSAPDDGFRTATDAAESLQPETGTFVPPVYSDEFRYWLVHEQHDILEGALSRFCGAGQLRDDSGRLPYGHFTYEEADQMCCVSRGTIKAIVRQSQFKPFPQASIPNPSADWPRFCCMGNPCPRPLTLGFRTTEIRSLSGSGTSNRAPYEVRRIVLASPIQWLSARWLVTCLNQSLGRAPITHVPCATGDCEMYSAGRTSGPGHANTLIRSV